MQDLATFTTGQPECRVQFKVSTARSWYREICKIDADTIIEIVQFNSAYPVTPVQPGRRWLTEIVVTNQSLQPSTARST